MRLSVSLLITTPGLIILFQFQLLFHDTLINQRFNKYSTGINENLLHKKKTDSDFTQNQSMSFQFEGLETFVNQPTVTVRNTSLQPFAGDTSVPSTVALPLFSVILMSPLFLLFTTLMKNVTPRDCVSALRSLRAAAGAVQCGGPCIQAEVRRCTGSVQQSSMRRFP